MIEFNRKNILIFITIVIVLALSLMFIGMRSKPEQKENMMPMNKYVPPQKKVKKDGATNMMNALMRVQ